MNRVTLGTSNAATIQYAGKSSALSEKKFENSAIDDCISYYDKLGKEFPDISFRLYDMSDESEE